MLSTAILRFWRYIGKGQNVIGGLMCEYVKWGKMSTLDLVATVSINQVSSVHYIFLN